MTKHLATIPAVVPPTQYVKRALAAVAYGSLGIRLPLRACRERLDAHVVYVSVYSLGVFRRRLDHQIDLHGGKKQTRNQISLNRPPFRTKIHVRTIQGLCVKRPDLGNLKFRNNSDSKMNQSETAPEVTPCYPLFFPCGVECGRYAVAALPLSPHPACVCHAGDQHAQPLHRRKSSLWYR